MDRENLKKLFLEANKLVGHEIISLQKDASHRSYERIKRDSDTSLILMDAPPEHENSSNYIKIANFLNEIGLNAPKIFNSDLENGFLLIEDLGNRKFTSILSEHSDYKSELSEEEIYAKAIDSLIHLHKNTKQISLEDYDESKLLKEARLFIQYYIEILNADHVNKTKQEEYNVIFKHLLKIADSFSHVVVLRDFHADNLMLLDNNEIGLLDFQDAVIGSPVYDLVSLLEDARRDVSAEIVEKMINRYLRAFPSFPRKEFMAAYAIFAVQRNLKIIGVFARQAAVYKNPSYLKFLPRVWRHVNHDLKHPLLLPLKKWLEQHVPLQLKY